MKRILAVSAVLFITIAGISQNKTTSKADGLFDTYQYVDAINAYKELVNSNKANDYVYARLADSYYNVFNTKEAIKWYAKAVESKQPAEVYYRYAQSLKAQGQYEDANKQMAVFAKMLPSDQRAKDYLANPNYIPRLVDTDKLFDV
ncbi:MAG: tetratricopeptide repeat protein, partial [Chitinophagaceae bacterium]